VTHGTGYCTELCDYWFADYHNSESGKEKKIMPEEIAQDIVLNVVNNVLTIALGLLGTYGVMFVVKAIVMFAGNIFSGTKIASTFRLKDGEKWDL
jgi:hypothetical protein